MQTTAKIFAAVGQVSLTLFALVAFSALVPATVDAQQVSTQLSSREAYIGSPIAFQIQIKNAQKYSLPEGFEIDGCDVQAAGRPSQSSQIRIYNGKRSESRSVTIQYRITPRREGTFEVPKLEVEVDGETKTTQSLQFIVTKSETGDLLFVEIKGKEKNVYVGEPLELTLKVWVKPYQDRQNGIKFSESNMWQLISDTTNWGPFSDRIKELAGSRQRPAGKPVLRDNGHGESREYFLFEVDATVYPTKPGKIDGDDVQVVVNYPLELGRSRDPFESMFGDRGFGGSALMKQMMEDDFFGGSALGRRLTVTKSRPIVANAEVDSTTVLPIPTQGKPLDYRGAVGRYRIVARTESKTVDAGDPVTLRIGIVGDGPMDLVQAPPLSELSELTDEFKVEDQSLAGFVQDNTKVFVTTIRPRSPSVTEIPPIPFSFFDPEKEAFETVYSDPISLTVNESESLSLDSIVSGSNSPRDSSGQSKLSELDVATNSADPNFENSFSLSLLSNQQRTTRFDWKMFAIVPPLVWLVLVAGRSLVGLGSWMPSLRSAEARAITRLQRAEKGADLQKAMIQFVADQSKQTVESTQQAAGALRMLGLSKEANEFESFIGRLDRNRLPANVQVIGGESPSDFQAQKDDAIQWVRNLNNTISSSGKSAIRSKRQPGKGPLQNTTASFLLVALACSQGYAIQGESNEGVTSSEPEQRLTDRQLESIFEQANESYQMASEYSETAGVKADSAEAKVAFSDAANQYQAIVDQGVRNSELFVNLANAQWKSNQPGHAIANYHRALRWDPNSTKAAANLTFALSQIGQRNKVKNENSGLNDDDTLGKSAWDWLRFPIQIIGPNVIAIVFACASVIFWGLVALRTCWFRFPVVAWASVPLLVTVTAGLVLLANDYQDVPLAVAVVDQLDVHAGDGHGFEVSRKIESATGRQFPVLSQRGGWFQVSIPGSKSTNEKAGWVHQSQIEAIAGRSFWF